MMANKGRGSLLGASSRLETAQRIRYWDSFELDYRLKKEEAAEVKAFKEGLTLTEAEHTLNIEKARAALLKRKEADGKRRNIALEGLTL